MNAKTFSEAHEKYLAFHRKGVVLGLRHSGSIALGLELTCALGCEGIVSKRLGWRYRSGRDWLKMKNPAAPAVKREAEEDWG